jgi:hypothetical protein
MVQTPGVVIFPGGMVPPVKLTVRGKVAEAVPPQVVVAEPGTIVNTVPGKVSETFTPVYGELVGFCNVIVRVVVPPAGKVAGEKLFVSLIASTLSLAEA